MNKNREKAVSLVGEEQVRQIEHAFNSFLSGWLRLADMSSQNWYPYDFFSNYLGHSEDVQRDTYQAFATLNRNGIDLEMMIGELWVECDPDEMEEC